MTTQVKNDTREWLKIIIGGAAVFSGIFYAGKLDQHVSDMDTRLIKVETWKDIQQSQENAKTAEHIKNIVVK